MPHPRLPARATAAALAAAVLATAVFSTPLSAQSGVDVAFAESADFDFPGQAPPDLVSAPFTPDEQATIRDVAVEVEGTVRGQLPGLPDRIRVAVAKVDRDLSTVGGVSGRAAAPGRVVIEVAVDHDGGLSAQVPGLRHALLHEFHHLARGWTIRENRFGPGIAVAAANEGLAEVFAEERTGRVLPANEYPDSAHEWAREILALPTDADYGAWMFEHPDGRLAIGYRTGRYLVHRAMERSGMTVVELSRRSPDEIWALAEIDDAPASADPENAPTGPAHD